MAARVGGFIRLVHPFPSLLDGLVVVAVSLVAGGEAITAARLGLAMFALQASIGALNDVIDAPRDAGRKSGKPIPAGLVSTPEGQWVAGGAGAIGIWLTAASGLVTVGLALSVLAIGYGYDLFAKGTVWSWLPFAVGIPLLPVFGWYGTTGELAPVFALLVPVAVLTGAALAIVNARADLERDTAARIDSVAIRLGRDRSWRLASGLLVAVAAIALVTLLAWGAPATSILGACAGSAIIGIGIDAGRDDRPARLERAWELQAVGVGVLAAAWLAGWAAA